MHPETLGGEPFLDPLGEPAALIADGRAGEVIARCEALLAQGRGGILTRVALGRALVADGRANDAISVLREASLLSPDTPEVVLAFGEALAAADALPTAIAEFQRASRLAPNDGRPHRHIAQLWLAAGEPDRAEAAAATAAELGAIDDETLRMLRSRTAKMRAAERADAGYVRQLFNQFAAEYDTRMSERLGYSAPAILLGLARSLAEPDKRFDILDLGCGTGLSGLAFKPFAKRLTGVDLSPRMLEHARKLGIYDDLLEADIETLPADLVGAFDMIIAADVLVYLGDLRHLFATVASRLTAGGLWVFTTERGEVDFARGAKRRYRHSDAYLRRLAADHKLEVATLVECVTRYEAGAPVVSWAGVFRAN